MAAVPCPVCGGTGRLLSDTCPLCDDASAGQPSTPTVIQNASAAASVSSPGSKDPIVMYVILRNDLDWPAGAMVNQACHACAAVTWASREDAQAMSYFSEVEGQMTTVTMGVSDEAQLNKIADKLRAGGVQFRIWTEQPENVASALATWPRRRSELQRYFKGIKRY
eukprot:TRINITY_DN62768_c0_g1_i1.p1 TRINITY_DN62768_c0_g1~~TRINITY_DN62768_c0_g1_i1.p1  ORF type:complete len:166 (+),score=19.22 TRINITY_DN62768_c0_g1_i1:61-558(+)